MLIAYLRSTVRQTLLQPAIIFLFILQTATLVFLGWGISFEYRGETLISVSLLGKIPLAGQELLIFRQSLETFVRLGWETLKFLLILAISPSFVELLRDPLLSIILTKRISRPLLICIRWSGVVLTIGIIQALYATSVVFVLLLKTNLLSTSLLGPMILGPVVHVITLAALASLLGVLLEHATGVTVVVLAVNYLGAFVGNVSQQTDGWLHLVGYLFPALATEERFFMDMILYGSSDVMLSPHLVVYPLAYLGLAMLFFKQKDL